MKFLVVYVMVASRNAVDRRFLSYIPLAISYIYMLAMTLETDASVYVRSTNLSTLNVVEQRDMVEYSHSEA